MSASGAYSRRDFLRIAGAGAAAGVTGFPAVVRAAPGTRSVVVLGIDGMDPTLLVRFRAAKMLPNISRLIEQGGFMPLATSDPPQSPVAWSNVISGTNPGGHGIFDFISWDSSTLTPYLSTSRIEGEPRSLRFGDWTIPLSARDMVNLRKGPTFWSELGSRGIDCTVLRMPANFPPTECNARSLSGLGTPDIHGSYGIFSFFTDKAGERTRDVPGGCISRVRIRHHCVTCTLPGPSNSFDSQGRNVDIPFKVYLDPENPVARISLQGQDFILREGEWSEWITLRFTMLPHLVTVSGVCRFFLKKARRDFALYVSPVNIDPAHPSLPITTPDGYSRRLAGEVGCFYTQGMPQDTSALSAGALDDDEYRHQAGEVLDEEIRLFKHEFGRFRSGFFFSYFSSLDLNSHAFWRTLDMEHPLFSPELRRRQGDFIPWLYRQMDAVIGHAMERLDDRTVLLVMSDHGFGSFRRQFNLNAWLLDNGYAAPSGTNRGLGSYFADIRWPQTRAFGLGINSLYLNLKGREAEGCVEPGAEAHALLDELASRLKQVRDPANGERVITNVFRPSRIYSGPYVGDAPDLIVGYGPNYRASWDTVLGKYPREHVLDNTDPWSGDHTMDSQFMSGVLLSSRKIQSESPALQDIAPTVLRMFGAPPAEGMTGKAVI